MEGGAVEHVQRAFSLSLPVSHLGRRSTVHSLAGLLNMCREQNFPFAKRLRKWSNSGIVAFGRQVQSAVWTIVPLSGGKEHPSLWETHLDAEEQCSHVSAKTSAHTKTCDPVSFFFEKSITASQPASPRVLFLILLFFTFLSTCDELELIRE